MSECLRLALGLGLTDDKSTGEFTGNSKDRRD